MKQDIQINGVRIAVDEAHVKRLESLAIGDRIKVLAKVYDGHRVYHGTIIGFEPFKKLPTIIIAYMEINMSDADIKFLHFNEETRDMEIVAACDAGETEIDKEHVLKILDKQISAKRYEIKEIEEKKQYFIEKFRQYWSVADKPVDIRQAAAVTKQSKMIGKHIDKLRSRSNG